MASDLLSVDELAALGDSVVLLDIQFNLVGTPGRELYAAAHLPGASFVDIDTDLSGPPGLQGRHPLPDPADFEASMRRVGVDTDSAVVVYDQRTSLSAARAWWTLRYFGIEDVRVLDGGLAAWQAAGLPVSTEVPDPSPSAFVARPGQLPTLDPAGAARLAREGVLLDVRAPERFRGETEPIDPVAGHIPYAGNAPAVGYLAPDGRFRKPDELTAFFGERGVHPGEGPAVGTYCGSGVTAAQAALALHEIGVDATPYVGSWSEWIADPSREIATGD